MCEQVIYSCIVHVGPFEASEMTRISLLLGSAGICYNISAIPNIVQN